MTTSGGNAAQASSAPTVSTGRRARCDVDQPADQLRFAVEVDELVVGDCGRQRVAAAVPVVVLSWRSDLVDEHLGRATDPRLVGRQTDPLLQVEQGLQPALLLGARHVVVSRAAGVPGRTENAAAKTVSKRTWRSSASVFSNCASVSPQKPTMTSVVRVMPGTASRSLSTSSRYASTVYCRPIRRSTASSPDCTGRWRCSHTDGTLGHRRDQPIRQVPRVRGHEAQPRNGAARRRPSAAHRWRAAARRCPVGRRGRCCGPASASPWTSAKRASTGRSWP